ncbi:MAG: Nif3-like dinuclear metal center hexameric protein [Sedimentisphaerales bacterium]|nr:Nif3-like dinuclear metal center hexameric protein [Sedimentisphaerales bacterium]
MKLAQIMPFLDKIAPLSLAESWDNVGLLAGDPASNIKKVILTIDLTPAVLAEARDRQAELILAYHPPLFEAVKQIVPGMKASPLLYEVIRSGKAIYALHTALDMAQGGVNDMLAEIIGIKDPQPLALAQAQPADNYKIVVFVPVDQTERVAQAMFAAGAGTVGEKEKYTQCSFRTEGTGSFKCGPESHPAIGTPGSVEMVRENRLETIVPQARLSEVVKAMRAAHSYEEVAYEIYPLVKSPEHGLGRWGQLAKPVAKKTLIAAVKKSLHVKCVGIIGPESGRASTVAVAAGSCGSLLNAVIARGCDLYLTGELKHHDALKLQDAGVTTICVGHSNSERLILARIAGRLNEQFLGRLEAFVSKYDKDPINWK